jgi:eukaryotic-like serine/threonine-protein kinase
VKDLRDRLQESLGDAYPIERELGGGGMSRVFLALDRTLGRRIVVKVLPVSLSSGDSVTRFRREIAVAAQLTNPHIVPLLSAGEVDGLPYYTMPFVEGESLRERLARGALPIPEVVSIMRDVARALEYAHRRDIIHRDVKPGNILLTGESAVITDFGIARALRHVAATGQLTSAGVAVGTPAYMAPEQAAADSTTDLRADLYAFGATAYEMLAGHEPFPGRSAQGMLAAHATQVAPPIATLRPATPEPLAELVMRCLEKQPADRPQSASEILQVLDARVTTSSAAPRPAAVWGSLPLLSARLRALRGPALLAAVALAAAVGAIMLFHARGAAAGATIRTLAVLPFDNASGDAAAAYLEDGIADRIRDALHAVPALTVKARSSSRLLKGRNAHEVGARLGVDAVLQGTVSVSRNQFHITAELVRAADDGSIWSGTFDSPASDLAGTQERIAQAVADQLHVALANRGGGATDSKRGRGTADPEAYVSFLRGRYAFDHMDFARASGLFHDAVTRDPQFATAHGYLAMAYANSSVTGVVSLDSVNQLAAASARRALALDSSVAEAYVAQSFILLSQMRFAEALEPMTRALALDSGNVAILTSYGLGLAQVGRVADGLALARRALDRDPLSATANAIYGYLLELSGQLPSALTSTHVAIEIDPNNSLPPQGLGFIFAFAGMPDSALAAFTAAAQLDSIGFAGRSALVFGYAAAGRWSDAARERARLERDPPGNSPHYRRAIAALAYGETGPAMTELERSVTTLEPMPGVVSLPCDPLFDPLKRDPRFDALMRRLGARACPPSLPWPIGAPQRAVRAGSSRGTSTRSHGPIPDPPAAYWKAGAAAQCRWGARQLRLGR